MNITARKHTTCAMLAALGIVLSDMIPAVKTPVAQISFGFIPVVAAAVFFGAEYSMIVAALIDVCGTLMFPSAGAFNPVFTFTAVLNGFIYGKALITRPGQGTKRIILSTVIGVVLSLSVVTIFLNTYNIALITYVDKGVTLTERFFALLPTRLWQAAILLPMKLIVIIALRTAVYPRMSFLLQGRNKAVG